MEKKEKKGFWASLFSSKPCQCACDSEIKEIKVLGPGCARCKTTYAVVEKVIKESGMDVQLTKVDDIEEIMRYNIMATPAIVADGKVVLKGKVPTEAEVRQLLGIGNEKTKN